MKYRIPSLLWLGCLAGALLGPARATEPESSASALHQAVPPAYSGKVLLLDNECLLEGTIERVDNKYRIRRRTGETLVPADTVVFVGQSVEDAYRYLRSRANLKDADEHMRLANWCRQNGLHAQSREELRAVVQLRPNHPASRDLIAYLRQSTTPKTAAPRRRRPEPPPPPPVDLTADAMNTFATHIQPILMNTCASCHATERNTSRFRLTRVWSSGSSNRTALQYNLAAVLAQVNVLQPESSKLLSRAVIDHGRTGQPPLRNRQCPPYRALEEWVRKTIENNPQLRERPNATVPAPSPPAVFAPGSSPTWGTEHAAPAPPAVAAPPAAPLASGRCREPSGTSSSSPARLAGPTPACPIPPPPAPGPPPTVTPGPLPPRSTRTPTEDVVDPEEFNRMAHPERTPPDRPMP
jgi:hypothetical protein